ncbi:hypothetical protein PILCRDRAFT_530429 [Piloderma croceum F 1598]|uniref:FAD/NAD(P)-binding domain-containing protein n=1 Tax=Piloderma croceum (strain F 1598) TaxID=765440 RepID=A0A0C3F6P1_PILCF|nr:hypothetical protein PILCRDRAFT_530429 [Piloderma croceum F 1598]
MVAPGKSLPNGQPNNVHRDDASTSNLPNHCIDEGRHMRIVIIGAGFSGILAAIRFRQKFTNIELVLYEKNAGVGGTWLENKYPGVAVDTPAHAYTFNFENNPYISTYFAPGPEILKYLQMVADKYRVHDIAKYNHELVGAKWNEGEGKWHLSVKKTAQGGVILKDTADLVLQCTGLLNQWDWPDIQGLKTFKGRMHHTASWDDTFDDWEGKRVAVIGNGASAIQVVTALQPRVKHLTSFARNQAWIVGGGDRDKMKELGMDPTNANPPFPKELQERFAQDPALHKAFRTHIERSLCDLHGLTIKGHETNKKATDIFRQAMLNELKDRIDISENLIPDWPVTCRRINPAPGYLNALKQPNVFCTWSPIEAITVTGIRTVDGKQEDFDVIACATGFKNTYVPSYPIEGRNGAILAEKWKDFAQHYLTVATDDIPNWFMTMGPQSGFGTCQLLIMIEAGVNYAVTCAQKMQRERIKSISVKKEAVDDFTRYSDNYFPTTNFLAGCNAWYRRGGRVVGIYPGSVLHAKKALEYPRWEDYEITYQNGRFGNFGNGWTVAERDGGETAEYVRDVDLPEVPGEQESADSWRRRQLAAPMPPIKGLAGNSAVTTA